MKVLLINPPDTNSINCSVGKTNTPLLHLFSPPLGLMYIKAYLNKETDADVRLFNFQSPKRPSLENFKTFLKQFPADVIGITVNTFFWFDVCQIVKIVRALLPDALIVGGGAHMWLYPEENMKGGNFDIIVQGPGTTVLKKIITHNKNAKGFSQIKGIFYKDGDTIKRTPNNDEVKDLNDLPFPDRANVDISQYRSPEVGRIGATVMMASTGCPFNCAYCDNRNRKYRARRVDSIVEELLECQNMGYKAILFYDDVFTCSKKQVISICQALIESDFHLPWSCRTRVDCLDHETIQWVVKAGCERINLGVESGNQDILDTINKKITLRQCREIFSLCKKENLITAAYFIIGFPGETEAMALRTFRFAEELNADYVVCTPLVPLPGTEIYRQAITDPAYDGDWLKRYILNPTPKLEVKLWETAISEEKIVRLINRFYRRYYLRPHRIIRHLKLLKSKEEFLSKARAGLHVITGR